MASTDLTSGESSEPPRVCQVKEEAEADIESCPRATPRKGIGGYECEFVEPPPKQVQSECSICLLVLREPHIVSCCGHNFCQTCIGHIQRDGKPCPLCNELGFTTMANKGLKRILNDFQVRCPHRELGCEWASELGKLDQHLNATPQPEHQFEGCQFASIKCIHCKDHMRRHVIAGHQNEQCPKRPYTCEHCEEYESTFENVVDHWEECKCYLLPCPNDCNPSGSGIERQNLEHHMKEECPLTVVECDFHYAGCGVKLPRKDMAVHMKEESVAHISLLAAENQRLAKQLLEREEKMQQLMQQNAELSDRIDQQEKDHKEQLRDVQQLQRDLVEKVMHTTNQQQISIQELRDTLQQATPRGLQMREGLRQISQPILPVKIKMNGFKRCKDENITWYSPPFYTHMCGYKMCLRVDANGDGDGKGTHVSVYTCFMRGEFDSDLKWPFRGDITIQLLNQLEDNMHHTRTISYSNKTPDDTASITFGEKSQGWGNQKFICHSDLKLDRGLRGLNRQYLKFGCLIFRVQPVLMYI